MDQVRPSRSASDDNLGVGVISLNRTGLYLTVGPPIQMTLRDVDRHVDRLEQRLHQSNIFPQFVRRPRCYADYIGFHVRCEVTDQSVNIVTDSVSQLMSEFRWRRAFIHHVPRRREVTVIVQKNDGIDVSDGTLMPE